jgi:hypothetical protein
MQSFFEPRVNRIVELIHDQVQLTENEKKRRVRVSSFPRQSACSDGLISVLEGFPSRGLRGIKIPAGIYQ